jgi:citronellol/citronellal dehydrogenase
MTTNVSLAGKTLFITGASRGIGLAIALKAARDGANIAIAAKTADPNPKLPGTIFSAAAEIEKAGGNALPIQCDIRLEDQVAAAVKATTDKFGGIDICVNNASAISLTRVMETEMKRFDLMQQVNSRGTFLVSKLCLPHLLQAPNPHILMLSPPLELQAKWFVGHTAYSMAKYGMSMCVLGLAAEFAGRVAVNALWPRTAIATAAVQNYLGGDETMRQCRKPEIVADAAYAIFHKPAKSFNGNFLIDDIFLSGEGVTDFDQYRVDPSQPLLPDFFVPDTALLPLGVSMAALTQAAPKA